MAFLTLFCSLANATTYATAYATAAPAPQAEGSSMAFRCCSMATRCC
ncbi:MAG: hypothetical protein ACKOZW_04640 [Cyanobium sp.]